jgi:hypothetical protein
MTLTDELAGHTLYVPGDCSELGTMVRQSMSHVILIIFHLKY